MFPSAFWLPERVNFYRLFLHKPDRYGLICLSDVGIIALNHILICDDYHTEKEKNCQKRNTYINI